MKTSVATVLCFYHRFGSLGGASRPFLRALDLPTAGAIDRWWIFFSSVDVLPENQKDGISASYNIPAFDGSRPGKFKINRYTFDEQ